MSEELPTLSLELLRAIEVTRRVAPITVERLGVLSIRIESSLAALSGAAAGAAAGAVIGGGIKLWIAGASIVGALAGGAGGYAIRAAIEPAIEPTLGSQAAEPAPPPAPPVEEPPAISPPPSESRAPSPPVRPPPSPKLHDTFEAERALVERARSALLQRAPEAALLAVDQHRRQFPRGKLAEERDGLQIRAFLALGRKEEAQQAFAAFARKYPESIARPGLEAAVERGR